MSESIIQFIKFVGIGVWNTVFDISLWHILLKILPPKFRKVGIAQAISFGTASVLSFILNLYWTFGNKNISNNFNNLGLVLCKFIVVTGFFTVFSSILITFLAKYIPQKLLSKLIVIILTLPLTYFIYKYFVYI